MERCGGDRGKGFFWSIDDKYAQTLEDASQGTGAKAGPSQPGKRKDKRTPLDPPLKRSIKGEPKGPLPPPLTSTPLLSKALSANAPQLSTPVLVPNSSKNATTGVFAYNGSSQPTFAIPHAASNPYVTLARSDWPLDPFPAANKAAKVTSSISASSSATTPQDTSTPFISVGTSTPPNIERPTLPLLNTNLVPDVSIPIVLGPIPVAHPDYVPGQPNNSAKPGYMILHERKLILDPDVFSGITQDMLKQLEKIGAMAAVQVLTGHMVRALKERRAKKKNKDRNAKKAAKAAKKTAVATASGLTNPASPLLVPVPTTSVGVTTHSTAEETLADPGSPIIVIDDPEDEAPAAKRRKLHDGVHTAEMISMIT